MKNYSIDSEKDLNFLEIFEDNNIFYGGHQSWLGEKSNVINGCGPIAASNILAYLSNKSPKYKNLYPKESFSKENYNEFQREMYSLLNPSVIGLLDVNKFVDRIIKYGKENNVDLKAEKLMFNNKNFNYLSCYSFIINGLIRDVPVAAFNMDFRKRFIFSWHWIVITRIYKDHENKIKVVVSSWGKRYDIYFSELFKSMKFGGGLVYFY